ncbi:hypothetical protein C9422_25960 [Pseudomonas sp. B1(2018)]|nr:hypothetical protein C9422_25960 [Pseudomonas sp. B1(2018)]
MRQRIFVGCQAAFASKPAPTSAEYSAKKLVGCQAAIAGKPAPTGAEYSPNKLVGCQAVFAGKPAPTGAEYSPKKLVGCQVAFAGKPAPTGAEFSPNKLVGCQAVFAGKLPQVPTGRPGTDGRVFSCRSCRRLRSFDFDHVEGAEDQDQKIAAFGSSYSWPAYNPTTQQAER